MVGESGPAAEIVSKAYPAGTDESGARAAQGALRPRSVFRAVLDDVVTRLELIRGDDASSVAPSCRGQGRLGRGHSALVLFGIAGDADGRSGSSSTRRSRHRDRRNAAPKADPGVRIEQQHRRLPRRSSWRCWTTGRAQKAEHDVLPSR